MKILLTGAKGQLGTALLSALGDDHEVCAHSRADFDLLNAAALARLLDTFRPELIVNAAAYTAVDAAQSNRATAFSVNAELPSALADWAAERDAALIHYSTEYVFDGQGDKPWSETDEPHPLNIYGESKLAGDHAILASGAAALILRTAWLYDATGRNFLTAILQQAENKETLRVVDDQYGAPTSTAVLARTTVEIIRTLGGDVGAGLSENGGLLNVTASGAVNRCEFAEAICDKTRRFGHPLAVRRILPIPSADLPAAAPRPKNSRLSLDRLSKRFGIQAPHWRDALARELERHFATT